MNRETESHFSNLPTISIKRSSFKRPSTHKTTFNAGDLIPIYVDSDILPGDTIKMNMASLLRMQTPIFPVMDNAYCDIYFFFVPHRIVWDHWKEFWGENNLTHWEQPVTYTIPQITSPSSTGWNEGTIADYMGIPTKVAGLSVNHLPFRAYCKIWNDWFRDENLKDPCMITSDETTVTGANSGTYVNYAEAGAAPLKVAKYHDFFTSALPSPQKAGSVTIPLGQLAPVYADANLINTPNSNWGSLKIYGGSNASFTTNTLYRDFMQANGSTYGTMFVDKQNTASSNSFAGYQPYNLFADLRNATAATINQLRQAFAVQAFYEAQARGGSRYIEFIKNIFGVTSPDGRQQRPEYLGGTRARINMDQVLQTSSTDSTSPQGNTAAFSCTVQSDDDMFVYSATEHGTLMGLACIRTDHTYQQGLNRMWNRLNYTDFYIPQFANLGEQIVENKEIYADGSTNDTQVFGYQEAWADYRYMPSRISGEMRSNYSTPLDYMHYGDDYSTLPTLSSAWIDETATNIDRTIAVQSTTADQFFADFYFQPVYIRPMPVYSIPATLNHF